MTSTLDSERQHRTDRAHNTWHRVAVNADAGCGPPEFCGQLEDLRRRFKRLPKMMRKKGCGNQSAQIHYISGNLLSPTDQYAWSG